MAFSVSNVLARASRSVNRSRPGGAAITNINREYGAAATYARRSYLGGEEYNHRLAGQAGLREFNKMRKSDAVIARVLKLVKTPVLAGRWFLESADGDSAQDNEIKNFVEWNLFQGMDTSWTQFLTETLTMMDFGYSFFEKVFANTSTPYGDRTILREFAPRSPFDVVEWQYDRHGRPTGVEMLNWETRQIHISMNKLITFTNGQEANNVEGVSVLRPAYKHWFFKELLYKIDSIQKERHGIGVPVMTMPHSWTEKDRDTAQQIGANLRTNEATHVVLPPNWELEFANPRGMTVNPLESIKYHDDCIVQSVLADFLITTGQSNIEGQMEVFLKAIRYIANIISDKINIELIPQLVRFNWPEANRFPKLMVRRISEEVALRQLSFVLRNFIDSDVIRPDDELEQYARAEINLPPKDQGSERIVVTPGDIMTDDSGGVGTVNHPTEGSDRTGGNR